MINKQYAYIFGIRYCITDYMMATEEIIRKALDTSASEGFAVSALAVHGLMEAYNDPALKELINCIDMVVPDGQPVRWALNHFHDAGLKDRVYGPTLTLHVLDAAARHSIPVFFFGSTQQTLDLLQQKLPLRFPGLIIAGKQADRFREATAEEARDDAKRIMHSGARIVFVGRGCPRQERWVAQNRKHLPMPLLAVGAAFDFMAGNFSQAPAWMQRNGLEWLYRLMREPGRLWKRYLFTNTQFIWLFLLEKGRKAIKSYI
jgi:N-acetylglucosaminyldiphosphoundecaprenol N-acetyl-beta-D-mannosaminyltransferase